MSYTMQIGDTQFDVTYNYTWNYKSILGFKGLKTLLGMSGAKSIPLLKKVIEAFGAEPYDGPHYAWNNTMHKGGSFEGFRRFPAEAQALREQYPYNIEDVMPQEIFQMCLEKRYIVPSDPLWKSTPGNAGFLASKLLAAAQANPSSRWR